METNKVTRFEIINHTPCEECEGTGWVMVPDPTHMENPSQQECRECHGQGMPGRTVYVHDKTLQFDVQLQDKGRTLKVFIHERYEDE